MKPFLILAGLVSISQLGFAQGQVLWQMENRTSATLAPPYQGQLSPFPMPKLVVEVESDTSIEQQNAAATARARTAALAQAKNVVNPKIALQLVPRSLRVKAASKGKQGIQVLIGNTWHNIAQRIPATFSINPATREALQELQRYDPEEAQKMATKLEATLKEYNSQGVRIDKIETSTNQMWVITPQGTVVLPVSGR